MPPISSQTAEPGDDEPTVTPLLVADVTHSANRECVYGASLASLARAGTGASSPEPVTLTSDGGEPMRDAAVEVPRLVEGTSLYGPYQGSGFTEERYLIGRPDGKMLLVSSVVYSVAGCIDGRRNVAEIAAEVSNAVGRRLDPANLAHLIEAKLRPLGVVAGDGEAERARGRAAQHRAEVDAHP